MKTPLSRPRFLVFPMLVAFACTGAAPDPGGDGDDNSSGSAGSAGSATGGGASGGTQGLGGSGNTSGTPAGGSANGGTGPNGGTANAGAPMGGAAGTSGAGAMGGTGGTGGGSTGAGGKSGSGGQSSGGKAGAGGKGGASGAAGTSGSSGSGTAGAAGSTGSSCAPWPTASGSQNVPATIQVSGVYDGMLKRYVGTGALGTAGQQEGQAALFELANGATLRNVILGNPAADGVHCEGACTLENVWWEDVGEDAATFRGSSSSQQMTVRCGGARSATDKVFQHNGAGTLTIQDFTAENFNKLYRSCGNCSSQYARHVILQDVTARTGQTLVGVNTNYGDSADFERITVYGSLTVCERYTGNSTGAEPVRTGTGSDSQYCRYESSDITQR